MYYPISFCIGEVNSFSNAASVSLKLILLCISYPQLDSFQQTNASGRQTDSDQNSQYDNNYTC